MFEEFSKRFRVTQQVPTAPWDDGAFANPLDKTRGFQELMARSQGATFNDGLYRIHSPGGRRKWTSLVEQAYPAFADQLSCFAYDWLGRQFALDGTRRRHGEPLVLLLEIGTGQALEIPRTFADFHEKELVEEPEASLLPSFFQEWVARGHEPLSPHQCVGFKVPLFLGGADELENLEVTDMEVYWGLMAQLLARTR